MNTSLFFVCGALRSGTSLLHLMLNHHPEIHHPGEFDFFFDLVGEQLAVPSPDSYQAWLSTHRIFLAKQLKFPNSAADYQAVLNSFVDQLKPADKMLALNMHRHFEQIPHFFPVAKYIHLIRDPRDVARSSIGMGWAGNVFYGVDHWFDSEKSWQKLKTQISDEDYLEIHFETLIKKPVETLTAICEFVGLQYDESMLSYAQNSTYKKPDTKLMSQWKTRLSSEEVELVESKAGQLMPLLGYKTSGPMKPPSFFKRLKLWLENKLFKLTFKIKRFGLMLVVKQHLARVLKSEKLNKSVTIQINNITKQHLK